MSSQVVQNNRENAEIYTGAQICTEKSRQLLDEISLPKGLLPLDDLVEVGYNRATGFVWLKQNKSKQHRFNRIGKTVSYDKEVTAVVENRRMKKLTGVKSKEFLIWVTISDIFINESNPNSITFANPTGISRSFPVSAFELEEEEEGKK
ncbi:Protein of unknown function DUF538 [Dillenia turbinata]|uniref:DUF538 domain-containing protein n=1 Tax=Dillenia turbinata TaxID=194707 RepID=A0AAN8YW23_9MAGN